MRRLGTALLLLGVTLAIGPLAGCIEDVPSRLLPDWELDIGGQRSRIVMPAHLGHDLESRGGQYTLRTTVVLDPAWRGQTLTLGVAMQRTILSLRVNGRAVPYLDEHVFEVARIMSSHRFRIDGSLTAGGTLAIELDGDVAIAEASWWDTTPVLALGAFGDRTTRLTELWNVGTEWISCIALCTLALVYFMLHIQTVLRGAGDSAEASNTREFAKLAGGAAIYPAIQLGLLQPLLGRRDLGLLIIAIVITMKASVQIVRRYLGQPPLPRWVAWIVLALVPTMILSSNMFLGRVWVLVMAVLIVGLIAYVSVQSHRVVRDARARTDLRSVIVLWAFVCVLSGVDFVRAAGWGTPMGGVQLTCMALLVFADVQAWLLGRDHSDLLLRQGTLNRELAQRVSEVERLNEELRRKVGDRSRELSVALRKLRVEGDGALAAGTVLADRYRVIAPLGAGAMGAVYRVERLGDGRSLAAKVVRGRVRPETLERFTREAELTARVDHPNVVRVYDVDVTSDGELFLVMELVDGRSLEDERARFGDRAFAHAVVSQIAGALQAIHACGIVHRDLKPSNVLVSMTDGPRIKVADFGIAGFGAAPGAATGTPTPGPQTSALAVDDAALDATIDAPAQGPASDPRLTATGAIIGTPLYMAPEVLHGTATIGPEADLFSLGLMAYQLFGGPPIEREGSGFRRKTLGRFAEFAAGLPAPLTDALQRCLHQDPTRRPTAQQLVELLAGAAARAAG